MAARTTRVRGRVGRRLALLVPDRSLSACTILTVYCVLLFVLPSKLIVRQVGSAGTPANLWGLFALLWWVCMTLGGGVPMHRPRNPVRVMCGVATVAVLVSYAASLTSGWYAPSDVRGATDDVYDLVPSTLAEIRNAMLLGADRGLLTFGAWMGITLVAVDGLRSWADIDRLVRWITALVSFVAGIGVLQFFTKLDIQDYYRIPGLTANYEFGAVDSRSVVRRVYATAIHPIEFGVVTASVFPLALHRAFHDRRSLRAWVPAVTIGLGIPMSVSRSAIVVLGIAMIVMLISWPPAWRVRFFVVAPVAAVAMRFMIPGLLGTIRSLFSNLGNDPSVSGRTDDYSVAFRVFGEHPFFGRGLYTFIPRYYRILDNQYLTLLLELGSVGLGAIVLLFVVAFGCARGGRRRARSAEHAHLGLATSAGVLGVVVSYATFDAWGFPMAAGVTFLLIGLGGAIWQVSQLPDAADEGSIARTPRPVANALAETAAR